SHAHPLQPRRAATRPGRADSAQRRRVLRIPPRAGADRSGSRTHPRGAGAMARTYQVRWWAGTFLNVARHNSGASATIQPTKVASHRIRAAQAKNIAIGRNKSMSSARARFQVQVAYMPNGNTAPQSSGS